MPDLNFWDWVWVAISVVGIHVIMPLASNRGGPKGSESEDGGSR